MLQYRPKKLDKLVLNQDIGDNLRKLVRFAESLMIWGGGSVLFH